MSGVKRGAGVALPAALVAIGLVAWLDVLVPPDIDLGELYVIPVLIGAWAYGWRSGAIVAAVCAGIAVFVDSNLLRANGDAPSALTVGWNAVSKFVVYAALAYVTDRFRQERERWRAVSDERARLLRLLAREFPRPLRAIDWFGRTFEEEVARAMPHSSRLGAQFAGLRHHTRELEFLAGDLLQVGRVRSGELSLTRVAIDLKVIATEAADQSVDRNRVMVTSTDERLSVSADPDALRHAISAVIGRLLDRSPHEDVRLFVRSAGADGAVEISGRGSMLGPDDLELADLLVSANGGRLVIAVPATKATVYVARVTESSAERQPPTATANTLT